jgi:hypothetical protein
MISVWVNSALTLMLSVTIAELSHMHSATGMTSRLVAWTDVDILQCDYSTCKRQSQPTLGLSPTLYPDK